MGPVHVGLVLIVVLSLLLLAQTFKTDDEGDTPSMLPGLSSARGGVNRILVNGINQHGDAAQLTMEADLEGGTTWRIREKGDYPVDFAALFKFLDDAADAVLVEQKTARREFHGQLGLSDSEADDDPGEPLSGRAGTHISILATAPPGSGSDGSSPAREFAFIKGKASQTQTGTFIRFPGEDQVWLTNKVFAASLDPMDWINPVAINIEASRVVRVEISEGGRTQLVAERNESGMVLLNQPADRALKHPTVVDGLARMLVNLRFEDVADYDPALWPADGSVHVATAKLDSGETILATTREAAGKFLLRLAVEATDDTASASADPAQYAHLENRQFELSEYVFKELTKTADDLLKPL